MVTLNRALKNLRKAVQILMVDSATAVRVDNTVVALAKFKLDRTAIPRSYDEQDTAPTEMRMATGYIPYEQRGTVAIGDRLTTSAGPEVWYVVDETSNASLTGAYGLSLVRQDNATPERDVTLWRKGVTGETELVGTYPCQVLYSALLPTLTDGAGSQARRVDMTLVGRGDFPARPDDIFAFGGLGGQILDVFHPGTDRVEATAQVMRGVLG